MIQLNGRVGCPARGFGVLLVGSLGFSAWPLPVKRNSRANEAEVSRGTAGGITRPKLRLWSYAARTMVWPKRNAQKTPTFARKTPTVAAKSRAPGTSSGRT